MTRVISTHTFTAKEKPYYQQVGNRILKLVRQAEISQNKKFSFWEFYVEVNTFMRRYCTPIPFRKDVFYFVFQHHFGRKMLKTEMELLYYGPTSKEKPETEIRS